MRTLLLLFVAVLTTQLVYGFGGYSRSFRERPPYIHAGLGTAYAGSALLGGGELLVAGNAGGILLGGNMSYFAGTTANSYGYSLENVKYALRSYSAGFNIGVRLARTDRSDFTIHCLFGQQIVILGARDTTGECHCGKFNTLASDNFWYVKPAVSFNNRRNFTMMASYNFLFADDVFGSGSQVFGESAAELGGPAVTMIWITNSKYRRLHYNRRHC